MFAGDTISARSEVIGLKENSNGKTGVVYVRSIATNQHDEMIVDYKRWGRAHKRDALALAPDATVPDFKKALAPDDMHIPDGLRFDDYDAVLAGSTDLWGAYEVGEKIDHVDGLSVEEAEHMMATRLYQNTAKVHFNQFTEGQGRFGRRLMYGGHVISLARALTFNGLGNAFLIAAINGGRHVAPCFGGDTVFAWSEVLECVELDGRSDLGGLRLRTIATKDLPCASFPGPADKGYDEGVVLDLDYWVLMPK